MAKQEKTAAGIPIIRHDDYMPKSFEGASGDSQIEAISKHIEKHLGQPEFVFHELASHLVHIDIHWVKPSAKFPFHILVTSGMSDKPMKAPVGADEHRYAELCVLLPADWKIKNESFGIDKEVFETEESYWPYNLLKYLARFPHEYDSWLGFGHTIPNGNDFEFYAPTIKFCCALLLPSITLPKEFHSLKISEQKTIKFFCIYPLYKEEMEFKLNRGTDALLNKFEKYTVGDIVDIERPNTCKKKKLFKLW
jgi:hypothetical protein